MVKPLQPEFAREAAFAAFNLLRSYRSTDPVGVLVDYLRARMAYIQSIALDVSDVDRVRLKAEYAMCDGLLQSLDAEPDGPLLIT